VGQDWRGRGVAGGGHHLLQSLAGAVLVAHEVWTEPGCGSPSLEMMRVVGRRWGRYLLNRTGVVAVAGGQSGRFVLQILDQVTRLDRVVNGGV